MCVAAGERSDRGGDHRAYGRIGIDDQAPRGAEDGIGHKRQDAGVKPDGRVETRELGIGDRDRQGHGRDRQSRQQVVPKVFGKVVGQKAGQPGCDARKTFVHAWPIEIGRSPASLI